MAAPRSRETKGPMAALRGQGAENTHTAFTIPNRTRGTFRNPGRGTGQAGSTVKHCQAPWVSPCTLIPSPCCHRKLLYYTVASKSNFAIKHDCSACRMTKTTAPWVRQKAAGYTADGNAQMVLERTIICEECYARRAEVRTAGGGTVSLTAQYNSQHLKQLCTTLWYVRATVPAALVSVENPWPGHFKEHCLVQEMIEDKVFYLYKTHFCAAATEALDGAVTVTASGGLAGGVFSKKPSALLLAGVDPKETMPICQKAACRMVIPNTSIHAWVIQGN